MTKHENQMIQGAIADAIYSATGEKTLNTTLAAIVEAVQGQGMIVKPRVIREVDTDENEVVIQELSDGAVRYHNTETGESFIISYDPDSHGNRLRWLEVTLYPHNDDVRHSKILNALV